MKNIFSTISATTAVTAMLALYSCTTQETVSPTPAPTPAPSAAPAAKAEAKAPPAKATKISGDIGLLDTEKNYLIVVTKEGKLVTVDFDPKFQPTMRTPAPSKVADIGLGSSATVQYTKQGDKNIAGAIEYLPAKGE